MDETQKAKQPALANDNGNTEKTLDKVERAELAVKRIEEGEKRLDEKLKQLQDLEANRLLGSTAGGHVEVKPVKEETAKEYANRVMNNKVKND